MVAFSISSACPLLAGSGLLLSTQSGHVILDVSSKVVAIQISPASLPNYSVGAAFMLSSLRLLCIKFVESYLSHFPVKLLVTNTFMPHNVSANGILPVDIC